MLKFSDRQLNIYKRLCLAKDTRYLLLNNCMKMGEDYLYHIRQPAQQNDTEITQQSDFKIYRKVLHISII